MKRKRRAIGLFTLAGLLVGAGASHADSLWERRNPYFANLFYDTKARRTGDVLTVVLSETTTFDGREDRNMSKETKNNFLAKLGGALQGGQSERSFSGNFNSNFASERELQGKSDFRSQRTLTDRMAVQVVGVEPNGNLLVEGVRTRVIANEERTIRISGVVRPNDIGAQNTVQSQFIANFTVEYLGRGPESSYTNNGWFGKVVNKVWPF